MTDRAIDVRDPSEPTHRISTTSLMATLVAAPAAWVLQLLVNYGLSSEACFPHDAPRVAPAPGLAWVWPVLLTIDIVTLVVAAAALVLALVNWQRARAGRVGGWGGPERQLMEGTAGRTRFLAVWGVFTSLCFVVALVFDLVTVFGTPLCGLH
jgi:hypothetical protein